mmetsp:Transcript_26329/g.81998  ORF Transcript_26329/g.81998 Transcript_26329/m.81998 type:complete len:222 (+) Transcript_26329:554-1219(+)
MVWLTSSGVASDTKTGYCFTCSVTSLAMPKATMLCASIMSVTSSMPALSVTMPMLATRAPVLEPELYWELDITSWQMSAQHSSKLSSRSCSLPDMSTDARRSAPVCRSSWCTFGAGASSASSSSSLGLGLGSSALLSVGAGQRLRSSLLPQSELKDQSLRTLAAAVTVGAGAPAGRPVAPTLPSSLSARLALAVPQEARPARFCVWNGSMPVPENAASTRR